MTAKSDSMPGGLYLIPPGEYKIIKHTKHGTYIDLNGSKLFIPKTDVNIEQLEKAAIQGGGN